MPEGMHIENGVWVDDEGRWVLPAMIRRSGPRRAHYFMPLRALSTNGRGTLVFDSEAVRAALRDLDRQINSQRGYKDTHHRQVRRKKRW